MTDQNVSNCPKFCNIEIFMFVNQNFKAISIRELLISLILFIKFGNLIVHKITLISNKINGFLCVDVKSGDLFVNLTMHFFYAIGIFNSAFLCVDVKFSKNAHMPPIYRTSFQFKLATIKNRNLIL